MHRTLQADQLHGPDQVSAANSWSTTGTRCTARKGTLSSQNPPPRTTPWSSRASGANARDHQNHHWGERDYPRITWEAPRKMKAIIKFITKGQHPPTKNNADKILHPKGTLGKTGKCGLLMWWVMKSSNVSRYSKLWEYGALCMNSIE